MNFARKNRLKYFFLRVVAALGCAFVLAILLPVAAKPIFFSFFPVNFNNSFSDTALPLPHTDTLPHVKKDSLLKDTTIRTHVDTVFLPKLSKDSLDAPVKAEAKDSIVLDVPEKKFYLYGEASTVYKDISLKAAQISVDQSQGILNAKYALDTAGNRIGKPLFKQADQSFESDSIQYSFKNKKAAIYNTVSQQGNGFVYSNRAKKDADNSIYSYGAAYTTCDLDTPHFRLVAKKVKVIPNKLMVSGPAHLEIEGIPTPLFIPFAIFPITQGQRTGILPPTYEVNLQKGIGLVGGGYYLGLGDHFDLTLRGDLYSYGSWNLTINPSYRRRYRYAGNFNLSIANTRFGDPKTPDFNQSKDFRILWSHSMDSKARPGISFSASVNAGTSTFNQYNVINPALRLNNTLSSSIAFSKTWQGKPFNLTLSANHNQNTSTRQVFITLPEAAFTVNTVYPFQSKNFSGAPKWYEKIGLSYTMNARNTVDFVDTTLFTKTMFDRFQAGVQHQVPINFSLQLLRNLTFSPNINYTERWYSKRFIKSWNEAEQKLDTAVQRGFFATREVSAGVSFSTALYGMAQFKSGKIRAIRHVVRPNIGFNYKPDLAAKDYYRVRIKNDTTSFDQLFSYYDGTLFGPPSLGRFGGISFGVDNNLEMKVFSKNDTTRQGKKVKLLDGFGINGSYNMAADSNRLSVFTVYARTLLFDKINISATGVIDPYAKDARGRVIRDTYVWQVGKPSIGKLTNGSISMSTSFKSKEKGEKKKAPASGEAPATSLEQQQQRLQQLYKTPGLDADFSIPWRLDLSYSVSFNKQPRFNFLGDTTIVSQSLSFNGDFNLTPKWKIGLTSGFDFLNRQLTYTTVSISRDLHCWQMAINIVPMGTYRSFSITISPKDGVLRDLRINRTRTFIDTFQQR